MTEKINPVELARTINKMSVEQLRSTMHFCKYRLQVELETEFMDSLAPEDQPLDDDISDFISANYDNYSLWVWKNYEIDVRKLED